MKRSFVAVLIMLAVLVAGRLEAQATGSIAGRVTSAAGTTVPRAAVTLVETNQATTSNAEGTFRFDNLSAGTYHVAVEAPRLGASVAEIEVAAGRLRSSRSSSIRPRIVRRSSLRRRREGAARPKSCSQ